MLTASGIKTRAQELGFDLCGIAPAIALPETQHLQNWLARGYAGDMAYMHKSADTRADIGKFLPGARSVIVTATNYYVDREAGGIARYAWGEDYHIVLADRLDQLVDWMREQTEERFEARVFVDKHHVQERAYAHHAGLGWIGKNTMLINRDVGSWTFLAGVAVTLELDVDAPVDEGCGSCTLCLDACPTGALVDEHDLDATRCISYLTIEHKGAIPEARRHMIGSHVYGCDVCQEVCPYNLAPLATLDPAWQPKARRDEATAAELWRRSDFELHGMLHDSAMTRVTLSRLRRNLAVVIANEADSDAAEVLERPGGGVPRAAQSADTPLVREHVEWARAVLKGETDLRKM